MTLCRVEALIYAVAFFEIQVFTQDEEVETSYTQMLSGRGGVCATPTPDLRKGRLPAEESNNSFYPPIT